MCSTAVNIFRFELAAVVIDRAFTNHCAYRSFHKISHPFLIRRSRGSVTLVKSNAKALLTGEPIKNATCKQVLRSPRGCGALPRCLRTTPQQGRPLKRPPCTPPKLYIVTSRKGTLQDCRCTCLCNVATLKIAIFREVPNTIDCPP